jgi:hypothetical protein
VAAALVVSSTAGSAAAAPVASSQAIQSAPAPWIALSMLDASGTVGLGGAAAQPDNPPPPEGPPPLAPPPPPQGYYGPGNIPAPVIGFWLATIAAMIYIASMHSSSHFHFVSNSPA